LGDAQELVSRQVPDYEIYVGLLCRRLGTPTERALSGTVEEFSDARQRYLDTPSKFAETVQKLLVQRAAVDPLEVQRQKVLSRT